jgi:quinol monooxygenase YgiN
MFGLIGTMRSQPGRRGDLAAVLLDGLRDMPGCLSYVVAEDPSDPDVLWITEAWVDVEAHAASLELAHVQEAIAKGRPLIAGMDRVAETTPVGGHGLVW